MDKIKPLDNLDDAIEYVEFSAAMYESMADAFGESLMRIFADNEWQIAKWLLELKRYRMNDENKC